MQMDSDSCEIDRSRCLDWKGLLVTAEGDVVGGDDAGLDDGVLLAA